MKAVEEMAGEAAVSQAGGDAGDTGDAGKLPTLPDTVSEQLRGFVDESGDAAE